MLVIATHNDDKFREIQQILSPIDCQSAKDFHIASPEETGSTFVENALIKARAFSIATQLPCIADDSGLVVPALEGKPGIYSARFAGSLASSADNRKLLLDMMLDVPIHKRHAYFYCATVYIAYPDDPTPLIALGQWNGIILNEERGQNGFGYDSLFYLPQLDRTASQLSPEEKNKLSHRGQALSALVHQLKAVVS